MAKRNKNNLSSTILMQSNLAGRVRNTELPLSHAMMPLFEAVINSIHSIEDANIPAENGQITIEIIRTVVQEELIRDKNSGQEASAPIENIIISDNGVGFNDDNYQSFLQLDSDYKKDRNCRGIGRLMWLKAFKSVMITSYYNGGENNQLKQRNFSFDILNGVKEVPVSPDDAVTVSGTKVTLNGFINKYRDCASTPKTAKAIARSIINHCCWYFLRPGGAPVIKLIDDGICYNLDDIFAEIMGKNKETTDEIVSLRGVDFTLTHTKLRDCSSDITHTVFFCAGQRLVQQEELKGKIPGLFDSITDSNSSFVYSCYVTSPYLDDNVSAERTGFALEEESNLFNSGITFNDIRDLAVSHAKSYLGEALEQNRKKSEARLNDFVNLKAPRYKSILKHLSQQERYIDPNIKDKELELFLYKKLSEFEAKLLEEGHQILGLTDDESADDYKQRISSYMQNAIDVKQSDLANYVTHRRVILDILRKCTQKKADGTYVLEEAVHKLIMPMRKESTDVLFDDMNLWIIDERLAFHNYLASDKTIKSMPITGSDKHDEPDILALQCYDNPVLVSDTQSPPFSAITVIEFKRPMRNDGGEGEKDPIRQALSYLDEVRNGKVRTHSGRPIPASDTIPGFCYVVCDVLSSIEPVIKIHQLQKTSDGLGYFGYNSSYKSYIEVITYDRLVNGATERNKAFFQRLGLPTD